MFEYLDCLIDGLKLLVGDQIKIPDRHHFDPDELGMFKIYLFKKKLLIH